MRDESGVPAPQVQKVCSNKMDLIFSVPEVHNFYLKESFSPLN